MSGPRNPDGTFPKGVTGNSAGRPPKARELAYLAIFQEIVTADGWRKIVQGAVKDTQSKDPIARNHARRFLAEYIIGKPTQSIRLRSDADPFEEFNGLSDEELEALAAGGAEGAEGEAEPEE